MRPLIIAHAHCVDGAVSAWVADRALRLQGQDPEVLFSGYQTPPPVVTGREVYLVDFSYPRAVLEQLALEAQSIRILDHHKMAEKDLEGLPYCVFDKTKSGASLTWAWFHPEEPAPKLVQYVEDYDLWRHALLNTHEVNAYLALTGTEMYRWDSIHRDLQLPSGFQQIVEQGACLLDAERHYISGALKGARRITLDGVPLLACNSTHLRSKLGDFLAEERGVALVWFLLQDGRVQWSLRSTKRSGVDVGAMSKKYGGGGHPTAAGFILSWDEHHTLWKNVQEST